VCVYLFCHGFSLQRFPFFSVIYKVVINSRALWWTDTDFLSSLLGSFHYFWFYPCGSLSLLSIGWWHAVPCIVSYQWKSWLMKYASLEGSVKLLVDVLLHDECILMVMHAWAVCMLRGALKHSLTFRVRRYVVSNEIRAPIANSPSSTQLEGIPTIPPS